MKKIIILIIAVLFFVVVLPAHAATISTESTLTIDVLPAFEADQLNENYQNNVLNISLTKTLAIRSNTEWNIQVQSLSYGFVNSSQCNLNGNIGLSNRQAGVGNNIQLINLNCYQEKSWDDNPNAFFDIYYTTGSKLSV